MLTKLSSLRTLDLSSTFVATFPPELVNDLDQLEILDLSSTYITGNLLPTEYKSTSLVSLSLRNNNMSVPLNLRALAGLPNLEKLDLSACTFNGVLEGVGQFQSLKMLDLSDNWLSSTIPPNISSLTSLKELHLNFNYLFGSIPVEMSKLTNLVTVDISDNSFQGVIPIEIVNLPNLQLLNVSGNVNLTLPE